MKCLHVGVSIPLEVLEIEAQIEPLSIRRLVQARWYLDRAIAQPRNMSLGLFKDKGTSLTRCWTTRMQDESSVEWTSDEREGLRPYLTRLKKEFWDRVWKRESCYAEMERHMMMMMMVY